MTERKVPVATVAFVALFGLLLVGGAGLLRELRDDLRAAGDCWQW